MKKYEYIHLNLKSYTAQELINELNKLGKEGWLLTVSGKSDIKGYAFVILAREINK